MPITSDSRYTTATVVTVEGPDGDTRQAMQVAFPKPRRITYTNYRVTSADRIDTIADDFYGNGRLWWMVADANPEIIDWMDLDPGEVLRVPNA